MQHVLSVYTIEPHKSLLMASRHEQHATVIADLFRVRLAVASETNAAAALNDEQVKQYTGGDRLRGRRMREDPWSFAPSHTLVMFSNHRPRVQGQDEGIWRRVRLIDWPVTIPEDERDEKLAEKLAAEAEGILAWIVEGAKRYLAEGLNPPDKVRVDTAAYRTAEDTVARFIDDLIEFDPSGEVASSELTQEHAGWCDDNGLSGNAVAGHWRKVAVRLKERGAESKRTGHRGRYWVGVRLR